MFNSAPFISWSCCAFKRSTLTSSYILVTKKARTAVKVENEWCRGMTGNVTWSRSKEYYCLIMSDPRRCGVC